MRKCPNCRERVWKVHRRFFEKLAYAAAYECDECGLRCRRLRPGCAAPYRFIRAGYTVGRRYGMPWLQRLARLSGLGRLRKIHSA